MSNQKGSIVIGAVIFLVLIYCALIMVSMRGCGYAGYRDGYAYRPSFFYWGGPGYYGGPSVRTGSASGPSPVGRGPGAGK